MASKSNEFAPENFNGLHQAIKCLNRIVNVLGEFKGNYDKKFNFSRLAHFLHVKPSEIDDVISLILNFQEKYEQVFVNYRLKKKRVNNQVYLIVERKDGFDIKPSNTLPKEIHFTSSQVGLLNDIVYAQAREKR